MKPNRTLRAVLFWLLLMATTALGTIAGNLVGDAVCKAMTDNAPDLERTHP